MTEPKNKVDVELLRPRVLELLKDYRRLSFSALAMRFSLATKTYKGPRWRFYRMLETMHEEGLIRVTQVATKYYAFDAKENNR